MYVCMLNVDLDDVEEGQETDSSIGPKKFVRNQLERRALTLCLRHGRSGDRMYVCMVECMYV